MHGFIIDTMRQTRGKWKASSHQKLNPCMASSLSHQCCDHWAMTTEQPLHLYCKAGTECIPSTTWCVSCGFNFALQSTVVIPLLLWMVPLNHIKTQLRELRYSSDVTQGLSQLGGWGQCVEQMGGGTLTLPLLCAHVIQSVAVSGTVFCHQVMYYQFINIW